MKEIIKIISFLMAGMVSFFSPLTIAHGDTGCCAECVLKKEEEIEVVDEQENKINNYD